MMLTSGKPQKTGKTQAGPCGKVDQPAVLQERDEGGHSFLQMELGRTRFRIQAHFWIKRHP